MLYYVILCYTIAQRTLWVASSNSDPAFSLLVRLLKGTSSVSSKTQGFRDKFHIVPLCSTQYSIDPKLKAQPRLLTSANPWKTSLSGLPPGRTEVKTITPVSSFYL